LVAVDRVSSRLIAVDIFHGASAPCVFVGPFIRTPTSLNSHGAQFMFWQTTRFRIDLSQPRVMGIVNVTPDSFSDGGQHASVSAALDHCERLLKEGADILDIGGESTRPGAQAVSVEEELARVLPVLEGALKLQCPVSLDTAKTEVMRRALDMGVDIVNDINALRADGAVNCLAAHPSSGVCLMHMQGDPQRKQLDPHYGDVVNEVKAFLASNGMTLDDIKQSTVTPPYENLLLLGRVDTVPGYIDAEVPELEAKAGGPGSLAIIQGSDFGYVVYGSGLFTSEKMIAEKSDVVQRFVNAYMLAFADVIKSPEEAADIIIKANPEYGPKKDVLVQQIQADVKSTFFSADSKANGIGWMTKTKWESTAKLLVEQGAMKQNIAVSAAFTDKFLTGASPLKR